MKKVRKCDNFGKQGYTLIEVVIVLMVTAVVFVSVYALFAKSIKYDTESRYEIIAAGLLQEAVEMIKNQREHNEMMKSIWDPSEGSEPSVFSDLDVISGCNPSLSGWDGGDYSFDCGAGSGDKEMRYNKTSGEYEDQQGCLISGAECIGIVFVRECNSSSIDEGVLRVECSIKWKSPLLHNEERTKTASLILTDWQE